MTRYVLQTLFIFFSFALMTGCTSSRLDTKNLLEQESTAEAKRIATKAVYFLQKGDFSHAKVLFEKADKLGHPDAPRVLGLMYVNGDGVERDYAKAMHYFQKAFDRGNYVAAYDIGAMYKNGEGVAKNIEKAKSYFTIAAKKEYGLAQFELAKLYALEHNKEAFLYWARKAAKHGYHFR